MNPKVKIYTTAKADLVSPKDAFALLGEAEVTAKWDVPPSQIGDVLALAGDSVDNIPAPALAEDRRDPYSRTWRTRSALEQPGRGQERADPREAHRRP